VHHKVGYRTFCAEWQLVRSSIGIEYKRKESQDNRQGHWAENDHLHLVDRIKTILKDLVEDKINAARCIPGDIQ
jgi:hypothetical protein